MFTPITFEKSDFSQIIKDLNFSPNSKITPVKGGLINALYEISDGKKSLIIRIYVREKPDEDILYEVQAMNYFREKGMPIPKVYFINENPIFRVKKYAAIILEKSPGKNILPQNLTFKQTASIAETIANLHKCGKKFPNNKKRIEWDLYDFQYDIHFIKKYSKMLNDTKLISSGRKLLSFIKAEAEELTNKLSDKDDFQTFIHNDLRLDNFLFEKEKVVALLDFDECLFGSPASDVATLWGQIPLPLRNQFIENYEELTGRIVNREKMIELGRHYKLSLLEWAISQYFKSKETRDLETLAGYVRQYNAFILEKQPQFPSIDSLLNH